MEEFISDTKGIPVALHNPCTPVWEYPMGTGSIIKNFVIQLSYTVQTLIFLLADLYHVILDTT